MAFHRSERLLLGARTRRLLAPLGLLLVLGGATLPPADAASPRAGTATPAASTKITPAPRYRPRSGVVERVFDGDSMLIASEGRVVHVRLYGVDCPEKGQSYAKKARSRTRALMAGRRVRIEQRVASDRYGRVIAEVFLPNGRSIGRVLVREGLAWHYRKYAPQDRDLAQREKRARAEHRGLWSRPHPVAPWIYRHRVE